MAEDFLYINKKYLQELVDEVSKRVVGKMMKRHDVIGASDVIKSISKDAVYEGFREFRDLILAYDRGLEISTFKFNKTGKVDSISE